MSKNKEEIIKSMYKIFYENAESIDYEAAEYQNKDAYENLTDYEELDEYLLKECRLNAVISNKKINLLLEVFSFLEEESLIKFNNYITEKNDEIDSFYENDFSCNNECDYCFDVKHIVETDSDDYDEDDSDYSDVSVDSNSDSDSEEDITPQEEFKIYLKENKIKK